MPQIHVLGQETINQIAAGEVVERPMAVVKELVENSIDAGANAITVEIQDGGKSLIRITDNGSGIAQEDIRLAFTPHATSKIHEVEDLLAVNSLGFRGEALASIAAVSRLEMISKTRETLMGNRYVIEGGEEKTLETVGCPEGTTFIVRNLFYNTPARLKFLKTSQTEAGYINTVIERLALSHPEIAFRFLNQNQSKLSTPGNGNLKDVIYHIYGRDIASNLLELQREEVFVKAEGFLGKPAISRGNRNYMNYYINGRYIRSNVIWRAIEEAYSPYTMQHRYPFTVLHFRIDPAYIDVNVHPQKMEIRFTREQEIFQSIYHAVAEGLRQKEFIPEISLQPQRKEKRSKDRGTEIFETKRRQQETAEQKPETEAVKTAEQKIETETAKTAEQKIETETANTAEQKTEAETAKIDGQRPESETQGKYQQAQTVSVAAEAAPAYGSAPAAQKKTPPEPADTEVPAAIADSSVSQPVQQSLFEQGELADQRNKELRLIGQVFSTYWIMEYGDKMYLVDQHAAHEKVLYERFVKQIREKKPMVQMLAPPLILTLSMAEQQIFEEHQALFAGLGFQIESFGGREYAVNGVPAHLPAMNTLDLLTDALDMLSDYHGDRAPDLLSDRIASMSCKAAVKGNNKLDIRQAEELLREMMNLENPYHCPHGRPTMISMTKRELEKKFKRIL